MKKIYLAGPVEEADKIQSFEWRERFKSTLTPHIENTCKIIDPLRGHSELITLFGQINDTSELPDCLKSSVKKFKDMKSFISTNLLGIRCIKDVEECDIAVFNFENADKIQAIGTLMELGAAAVLHKVIIVIAPENSILRTHVMVKASTAHYCSSIDECISLLNLMLC